MHGRAGTLSAYSNHFSLEDERGGENALKPFHFSYNNTVTPILLVFGARARLTPTVSLWHWVRLQQDHHLLTALTLELDFHTVLSVLQPQSIKIVYLCIVVYVFGGNQYYSIKSL